VTGQAEQYTQPPEHVRGELEHTITLSATSAQAIADTLHLVEEFLRCYAGPAVRAELGAYCVAQGRSALCGTGALIDSIGLHAWALRQTIDAAEPATRAGPSRDDPATRHCPACQARFTPTGRQRYCSTPCRKTAFRRRHATGHTTVVVPAARPRRPITVYECPDCGGRLLGEQRCDDCATFTRRVGLGGTCPDCQAPVAIDDLLDGETTITAATGPNK
jgi:hypothetical protein